MKKFFFALMLVCGLAQAQTPPPIIERQFYDDTYVHVPLQFGFPFYGRTFTNSWMHSNGVVSFLDPAVPVPNVGWNPAQGAYCCEGVRPSTTTPQFSYMIAPLWTDLYPVGQSRFRTQGDATFQRYHWENIAEISNMSNLNTFGLEIRPSGYIGALYERINIQNQNTWVGTIGDPTLQQWNQIHYGRGVPSSLPNWSMNDTPASQCQVNPLSSPTCPGYTQAMCSTNPLYSSSCSGYQQAYFSQQCSINSLYNVNCPGYAAAYLSYQCSINPLYSTTCEGYESAYFNQQCSANPLYSTSCSGYDEAYLAQQCSLDGLYSTTCPNYATAYATQQALRRSQQSTTTSNTPTATTQTAVTSAPTNDGSSSVPIAVVADPIVNQAVTSTATSTSPASAATATVPLVTAPVVETKVEVKAEVKEEKKDTSSSSTSSTASAQNTSTETKPAAPTPRQQLQARREAAARAAAVEKGKNLAGEMGKAADMEAQKAVQNVVIAAMGFTPGFDAYGKTFVPDGVGYKPFTVYAKQVNVDNRRLGMGLYGPSDRLHNDLVDLQYKGN